jgi:hypothetical protein
MRKAAAGQIQGADAAKARVKLRYLPSEIQLRIKIKEILPKQTRGPIYRATQNY